MCSLCQNPMVGVNVGTELGVHSNDRPLSRGREFIELLPQTFLASETGKGSEK